jgi:hypothetical protein
VRNAGGGTLNLTQLSPSAFPGGYTLVSNIDRTTLGPGASTTFAVRFQSATLGTFGGAVTLANSDADENPFDLNLTGTVASSPGIGQIIDNGQPGFSTTGIWSKSNREGYQGDIHFHAKGTGQDFARWTFDVTPGQYRVSATWSVNSNRATDAPYTVRDGTRALATMDVNQRQAPNDFSDQEASWEDLGGPYTITGQTLVVDLSDAANQYVIADAIRIERVGDLPAEIEVLDGQTVVADGGIVVFGTTSPDVPVDKTLTVRNVGSEFLALSQLSPSAFPAGYTLVSNLGTNALAPGASTTFAVRLQSASTGNFSGPISFVNGDADESPFDLNLFGTVATSQIIDNGDAGFATFGAWNQLSTEGYEGDIRFSAKGSGNDVARWTFNVTPGRYRVSATWSTNANRATDAPFTIYDGADALRTVDINQKIAPNDLSDQGATWEDLGGPYNITGTSLVVELSDAANQYVIADAVRIERLGNLAAEIEVLDGETVVEVGGLVGFGTTPAGVPVDKVLTVKNVGREALTLSPLSSSAFPTGFTLVSNFDQTNLDPGESTSFTIRLQSASNGTYSGPVSFSNSDPDESPFSLSLFGTVASSQIIDNGQTGFSLVGAWSKSNSEGYDGDIHFHAKGTGSQVARWTFDVTPGRYRVSATWSVNTNRATDSPFTIWDGTTVIGAVDVNQRQAPNDFTDEGASWEDLGGPYNITGSSLVVQLSNNANLYVIADAVRIERLGNLAEEIEVLDGEKVLDDGAIVDFGTTPPNVPADKVFTVRNIGREILSLTQFAPSTFPNRFVLMSSFGKTSLAPGESTSFTVRLLSGTTGTFSGPISFANSDPDESPFHLNLLGRVANARIIDDGEPGFSTVGSWSTSSGEGFQGDIRVNAKGSGSDVASWTFDVTPGRYRVSATWSTNANRATDSPFTVYDGTSPLRTIDINQEIAPNDFSDQGTTWEDLGGPYNITGSSLIVRLSDAANQYVVADAVRLERLGDLAPEIEVFLGQTELTDGGTLDFGQAEANEPVDRMLTVRNVGAQNLTLQPVQLADLPAGFRVVSNFGNPTLAPGASTTLTLRFQASNPGPYGGPLSVVNNDSNEIPFDLFLSASVSDTQVIDDGDIGFSQAGPWTSVTTSGFEGDLRVTSTGQAAVASWTFNVTPGRYRVSATWAPASNRATNAPFTVFDNGNTEATLTINQQQAPDDLADEGVFWEDLGGPYDIAATTLVVTLSNIANGQVVADAVRIERLDGGGGGTPSDDFEPNDTFQTAAQLGTGDQRYNDLQIDSGDKDYFQWVAPRDGRLAIDILFIDRDGDLDIMLYTSDFVRVGRSDSLDDNERIEIDVLAGQVFVIYVYGFGSQTNVYDLVIDGP